MKQALYILAYMLGLISCESSPRKFSDENLIVIPKETFSNSQAFFNDSIYKIDDFLFRAKKNAKFELIKKGNKSKTKTKGDTLYIDSATILLGDFDEMTGPGVFKKFEFKSQFDAFKVDEIYKGKLSNPNFSTDRDAKYFITQIKDDCKSTGVNFAGYYTIVEWGCGLACQEMAIVDRKSGEVIFSQIPFDTIDGHSGLEFRINSQMLIVNTDAFSEFYDFEPGYKLYNHWREPAVYIIKGGKLKQIE